ncbi:MAG: hypothetical protein Q9195_008257 [Heterodermia aff. obscurata]
MIGRATRINYSKDSKRILSVTYTVNGSTIELEATDIVIAAGPWTSNIFPRAKLLTARGHTIFIEPTQDLSPYVLFPKIEPAANNKIEELISTEIYHRPEDDLNNFDTAYSCGPDDYDVQLPSSTEKAEVDAQRSLPSKLVISLKSDHTKRAKRLVPCIESQEIENCVPAPSVEGGNSNVTANNPVLLVLGGATLEHLEQLVRDLYQSREFSTSHDGLTPDANAIRSNGDGMPYGSVHNGATHWSAMLEDIEELRAVMREYEKVDSSSRELDIDCNDATSLLFAASKPLSFQQILSKFLPPRHTVDQLIAAYFKMQTVTAPFIHAAQFRRFYNLFWENLSTASPLWTSMLFSILQVSTTIALTGPGTYPGDDGLSLRFDTAAAHCLALGGYYRPQRFAVEALVLFIQSVIVTNVDLGPDIGVLMGTLIRLAMVMGFHRDADESRERISAFDGEMRRRTWSTCMHLDMLISFQLGLPNNTQFPTCNTKPPTNLLDCDFDENTKQLPPPRPLTEHTLLVFYIAKDRLMNVFEKVIRHTLAGTESPSDELDTIDREIRSTMAALPATLQPRSMTDSIVDSPSVKVSRLCVYSIYQKCLCVLHRKYITRGRYSSLLICYHSASEIVRQFVDSHSEFEPGGQLETERWLIGSIGWHDFLLGCVALCLSVCSTERYTAEIALDASIDVVGSTDLLRNANAVLEKKSARSKDTRKAQRLVVATISKFSQQENGSRSAHQVPYLNGHNGAPENQSPATVDAFVDNPLPWSETIMSPVDDVDWAYLEHILNLPQEDLMLDT